MQKHTKQIEFFNHPARFKFALAGRRGGKTHAIVESICHRMFSAPPKANIYYVGPSNPHAKEIIWDPLKSRLHELGWHFRDLVSQGLFRLSRGRKIYIMGAENIDRIRGKSAVQIYLDELAFYKRPLSDVKKAIRPTLSDFGGGCWATTTPNGKGTEAYDFYLEVKGLDEWQTFHWRTIDNPYIPKEEIEAAKHELDERSFRQEYEASWESFEGLAYYNFDENLHVKRQPPIDFGKPLHICLDFNVNPTTLLVSQEDRGMLRYKKEYSFANSSTLETIQAFCEDFKEHSSSAKLHIRGDASGRNRGSNTGRSDYHYIFEMLEKYQMSYLFQVLPSNPPVVDRVNHVNGWLKPVSGKHRIEIDPCCEELIRDLSSQERRGRLLSDKNNRGHKADALGYDVFFEYKNSQRGRSSTKII